MANSCRRRTRHEQSTEPFDTGPSRITSTDNDSSWDRYCRDYGRGDEAEIAATLLCTKAVADTIVYTSAEELLIFAERGQDTAHLFSASESRICEKKHAMQIARGSQPNLYCISTSRQR